MNEDPTAPTHEDPDLTRAAGEQRSSPPLRRIGQYTVRRMIATGGMGIVYEAIQDHPRRSVALKVMRGNAASPSALRRFEHESQFLARLQHPGIASVYEAGTHDEGDGPVPFFVMEFIPDARTLTRYAEEQNLGLTERLELFADVLDAVEHGHAAGIIHRDLKPSNILVDAAGRPKVIDFGVARVAGADRTVSYLNTGVGELVGTLPYMSPEQCDADPELLDARSDVYSLGVVLFELLCGRLPYDVLHCAVPEVARIIKEQAPERPSVVQRTIRGDLETVVLKALAKDPGRRYASAAAFREDIQRYLASEPIQARPDSVAYVVMKRTQRSVRHHPSAWSLAAIVVAILLADLLAVRLVFRWTSLNGLYQRAALSLAAPAPPTHALEHVRIVRLSDDTDVAALARDHDVTGVDPVTAPRSLRRLHGRLMERLASSGVQVVAFDIAFGPESEYDDGFVAGAERLRETGADVVVGTWRWGLDPRGAPHVSPNILPSVRWGGMTANLAPDEPWALHLVLERSPEAPLASVALRTAAAFLEPGARVEVLFDPPAHDFRLRWWEPDPDLPELRPELRTTEPVRLSLVTRLEPEFVHDLRGDDEIGMLFVEMPPDDLLAASTIEYEDVFAADDATLRGWFGGRIAWVGDYRNEADRHRHPDGRELFGIEAQAVAIDGLVRSIAPMRSPTGREADLLIVAAAILGCPLGVLLAGAHGRRWLVHAIVLVAALIASLVAYRMLRYLCNPMVPWVAFVVAAELTAVVFRHARPEGTPAPLPATAA